MLIEVRIKWGARMIIVNTRQDAIKILYRDWASKTPSHRMAPLT